MQGGVSTKAQHRTSCTLALGHLVLSGYQNIEKYNGVPNLLSHNFSERPRDEWKNGGYYLRELHGAKPAAALFQDTK